MLTIYYLASYINGLLLNFTNEVFDITDFVSIVEPKNAGVSLAYQHDSENLKPDNSIVQRIDAVMASLVSKNFGAKKLSANEFTQLVSLLRKVDKKRMTPVMEKYFNCESSGMCSSSQTDLKNAYR